MYYFDYSYWEVMADNLPLYFHLPVYIQYPYYITLVLISLVILYSINILSMGVKLGIDYLPIFNTYMLVSNI